MLLAFTNVESSDPTEARESQELILTLKKIEQYYHKSIVITYTRTFYSDRKKMLGITWNKNPSMAFNFGVDKQIPFPENRKFTEDNIRGFIHDYITGQYKKKENVDKSKDTEGKKTLKKKTYKKKNNKDDL
jgi:hypothetical protein